MESFNQYIERQDHPQGDFNPKVAALQQAWKQLEMMMEKYHQIMDKVKEQAPEVEADLALKVQEAINGDTYLTDDDYSYLMQILVGHNRFDKTTYLKPWPKQAPQWWTGNDWN